MNPRPATLSEVAELVFNGDHFDRCLANFLDEFYTSPNAAAFVETPKLLGATGKEIGKIQDAYLAATAEELSRRFFLPFPPWIEAEERKLHRPWFASPAASLRAVLIHESPAGFRERNLFVSENALSRA